MVIGYCCVHFHCVPQKRHFEEKKSKLIEEKKGLMQIHLFRLAPDSKYYGHECPLWDFGLFNFTHSNYRRCFGTIAAIT